MIEKNKNMKDYSMLENALYIIYMKSVIDSLPLMNLLSEIEFKKNFINCVFVQTCSFEFWNDILVVIHYVDQSNFS